MFWPRRCSTECPNRRLFNDTRGRASPSRYLTPSKKAVCIWRHLRSTLTHMRIVWRNAWHPFRVLQLWRKCYSPNIRTSTSKILPTILCTTQVWMWRGQWRKCISPQQGKHTEEKRVVSHWTSCHVQRLHKHSTAFALSQERSQPGMSRWPVPCWPSNWTTSWAVNPSSTGTFRATKPQSSWNSSPEGLATRWGAQISSIAFIGSERRLHFFKAWKIFFDAVPNCLTGGRCWVGIQEVSDHRHGAQVVSDQRQA